MSYDPTDDDSRERLDEKDAEIARLRAALERTAGMLELIASAYPDIAADTRIIQARKAAYAALAGKEDDIRNCPNCQEPLDGLDAEGDECPSCAYEIACHHCGWPDKE